MQLRDRSETAHTGKIRYSSPRLTAFGSVRNLTGGSGGNMGDGGGQMTRSRMF